MFHKVRKGDQIPAASGDVGRLTAVCESPLAQRVTNPIWKIIPCQSAREQRRFLPFRKQLYKYSLGRRLLLLV